MAHSLFWPKHWLYPIGNTSAVCLTRDLAPEDPGEILLLGCGDPRNILYTIFCEVDIARPKLDFTCCDMDPAILARNVLLFTMVADKAISMDVIWNIFFHIRLDANSHSALVKQCQKLTEFSKTLQEWKTSPYGAFVKMCTEYTLIELRRHWSLYSKMQDLPRSRVKAIYDSFKKQAKLSSNVRINVTSARSAGPLAFNAMVLSEVFANYWTNGVTSSKPEDISAATTLNPTFVYSLMGAGCFVHYGTDPLIPFHFAALFGNAKGRVSASDAVKAAKSEFNDWCSAFHSAIASNASNCPVIRCFHGEAMAVCQALRTYASTGMLNSRIPVAPWQTRSIELSKDEYDSGAPVCFNVIDTSNLDDHLGPLNVLIITVPLLSSPPKPSVLYTESLLTPRQDTAAKRFCADITIISLLLGLCPIDYLSSFTSRADMHELTLQLLLEKTAGRKQFHQMMTWKSPTSSDLVAFPSAVIQPPIFDSRQLCTLLHGIYSRFFVREDFMKYMRFNDADVMMAISTSNLVHYTRESFVLFLKVVRDRLCIPEMQWHGIVDQFLSLCVAHPISLIDGNNHQDLCTQLHRHGLFTVPILRKQVPKIGRFTGWATIPPVARITLVIPREKLSIFDDPKIQANTPPLHCDIVGTHSHNMFASVDVVFGHSVQKGTTSDPRFVVNEDVEGWKGRSPLLASFTVPARLLAEVERPENLSVCFSVRPTFGTVLLTEKLGLNLNIFSANLMDESHVYVVPEHPPPSKALQADNSRPNPMLPADIGNSQAVVVDLDQGCECVTSLTCRVSVEHERAKSLFASGTKPTVDQMSPCVMRIALGTYTQDVIYPWPVIGSKHKLRLARKSMYIELVVPISRPLAREGVKFNPFPVVGIDRAFRSWNIHRVQLDRCPILDIHATDLYDWLNPHVGSMMSRRERTDRDNGKKDTMTSVKDTLHWILVRSAGIQGGSPVRLFSLHDETTQNNDTIFFISNLRYDFTFHTVCCDAYVLPLTHSIMPKILCNFSKLMSGMIQVRVYENEMRAWKQLLPALVERCRSTWKHGDRCEYVLQGKIPLTETMEEDPLCSCGRGRDVAGMVKEPLWRPFAPYVTRIALSPLFPVSSLEPVMVDDVSEPKCSACSKKGKMMMCTRCKRERYCSKECQRKDWPTHKRHCSP